MTTFTLYLLFLVITFLIVIYQFCSFLDVSPLDTKPLPQIYSSLSRTQKSRSITPPWSKAVVSTTATSRLSAVTKVRRNMSRPITTKDHKLKNESHLCDKPTQLGPIPVDMSDITLDDLKKKFPKVKWGGWYSPPNCTARHRVAIIVPYRDRKQNLAIFLNHMHPFLMKQKLEYGIFIVEQKGMHEFNRGKLMNVGFIEARHWQCYIFHDIDLLPLDERNIYSCPHPRHPRMLDAIAGLDKDALSLASTGNLGGVSAVTVEQFNEVNGYSNGYWGWGGEDNDLFYRLSRSGYVVTQYNLSIARYVSLQHKQRSQNPKRYRLLLQTTKPYKRDGLSNLHYELLATTRHPLYTHMLVNIDHTYHELQELFEEEHYLKLRPLKKL